MKDKNKKEEQLIKELAQVRQRITELETLESSHKEAETALRESQELYSKLVRTCPDAVTVSDLEGNIIEVSQQTIEQHGFKSAEELIGKKGFELIAPENREKASRGIQRTLKEGIARNAEYILLKKDGTRFIGEISAALIKDAYDKPKGFIVTSRDITERRQAEKALKKSEQRYQRLSQEFSGILDSIPDNLTFQDPDLKIIWANQTAAESIDRKVEDIIGKHCYKLWHNRDKPCKGCPLIIAINRRLPSWGEMSTPDGRFWEIRTIPIVENNKVRGVVELARDITDRRQAEESLRESEEKYRTIFENTGTATVIIEEDTTLSLVNTGFEKLSGYSKEEIEGKKSWTEFVVKEDLERMKGYHRDRRLNPAAAPGNYEFGFIDRLGNIRYISLTIAMIPGTKKSVASLLDITEPKKAESALRESEEKYRSLANNINVGVYRNTKGPYGKFIEANPAIIEMFGYKNKDEFLAINVSDLYQNPADREEFNKDLLKVGFVKDRELRLKKKDGGGFIGSVSAVAVKDEKGKILYFDGIVEDITERKGTEEAIKEERDRARKYLDIAAVMLVALDPNQKVTLINKKGCEILGYNEKEIIGKNWFHKFLPERIIDIAIAVFEKLMAGEVEEVEYRENFVLTKSGKERFISWHNIIIEDEEGNIVGTLSSGEDITERKLAQEELRRSEEKYSNLFHHSNDAIFLHDLEGNIIDVNQKVLDQFGYTKSEILSIKIPDLHPTEDLEISRRAFKIISLDGYVNFEINFKKKSGEVFPAEVSSGLFEIAGKKVIQGIVRDITERKRAEKELKESEERFKGIFENANDSIVIIDKKGFITLANRQFYEVTGYSEGEAEILHFSQLLHPEDKENILSYFKKALADEVDYTRFESRAIMRDGSVKYIDINPNAIRKEGEIIGIQAVIRDITEKKILEEKVKQNYKELITTIASFIEIKDLYTEEHSQRIVADSIYLAQQLNMSEEEIKDIEIAALLHDLGKIKIPGKILNKPGKLNKREEQIIRTHCQLGEEAIMNMPAFRNASRLIRYHHERYNGKGYPEGLKGEKILLGARIIAVVDAFDAMMSDRPYRRALSYEEAKAELIQERGKQFDPHIVDIYLKHLEDKYEKDKIPVD